MPHVRVAFETFDNCCEYAWEQWRLDRPDEFMLWGQHLREIADAEGGKKFWMEGKWMKHLGEVPGYVHGLINIYFPGYMYDKKHRDRFFKEYRHCLVDQFAKFTGTRDYDSKNIDGEVVFKPGEDND